MASHSLSPGVAPPPHFLVTSSFMPRGCHRGGRGSRRSRPYRVRRSRSAAEGETEPTGNQPQSPGIDQPQHSGADQPQRSGTDQPHHSTSVMAEPPQPPDRDTGVPPTSTALPSSTDASIQMGQERPISDLSLEDFIGLVRNVVRGELGANPPSASTPLSSAATPGVTWSSPLLTTTNAQPPLPPLPLLPPASATSVGMICTCACLLPRGILVFTNTPLVAVCCCCF